MYTSPPPQTHCPNELNYHHPSAQKTGVSLSKGTKIYHHTCIRILLLHLIYLSAISWVTFLKINFIFWPVMSASDNVGRLWAKTRWWFMDHIFNYLEDLWRWFIPTTTLFSGTSGMERWDLLALFNCIHANMRNMSGSTSDCLMWRTWNEEVLTQKKQNKKRWKNFQSFFSFFSDMCSLLTNFYCQCDYDMQCDNYVQFDFITLSFFVWQFLLQVFTLGWVIHTPPFTRCMLG